MIRSEPTVPRQHEDPALFREAVNYTAAETGFSSRLLEKDYFLTLVLAFLSGQPELPLVFKGGTCLAKIHAGFYRLSEDLDFMISVKVSSTRKERQGLAAPVKALLDKLPTYLPAFQVSEPLQGANQSRQYLGSLSYQSLVSPEPQTIKLEVSLREALLTPVATAEAKTLLLDPVSEKQLVGPVSVRCLSLEEALAEKCRAALSRREAAIRDFFDIDHAVQKLGFSPDAPAFVSLVKQKLTVAGNEPVDVGPERKKDLQAQLAARLRPVLRPQDFEAFDLDRAFGLVENLAEDVALP